MGRLSLTTTYPVSIIGSVASFRKTITHLFVLLLAWACFGYECYVMRMSMYDMAVNMYNAGKTFSWWELLYVIYYREGWKVGRCPQGVERIEFRKNGDQLFFSLQWTRENKIILQHEGFVIEI